MPLYDNKKHVITHNIYLPGIRKQTVVEHRPPMTARTLVISGNKTAKVEVQSTNVRVMIIFLNNLIFF
jgi:hypothetical protein